jgi:hypothetical protein
MKNSTPILHPFGRSLVALAALCGLLVSGAGRDAHAVNYFNWDVESDNTSIGPLENPAYGDFTTRDCTPGIARSGKCAMKMAIPTSVGDPSNIGAGARPPRFKYNVPAVGSAAIYYRWWMKIMPGFNFGNGQAKMKSSRILVCPDSDPDCDSPTNGGPNGQGYTGYIMSYGFLIGECDQTGVCLLADGTSNASDSDLVIPYDFRTKDDGQWHEYIVRIKPNTSTTCTPKVNCNAEFEAWVDGVKVGQYMGFRLSTNATKKMVEQWLGWMVQPYVQVGGSTSGYGGTIYLDDFSTDDTFNSTFGIPAPTNLKVQ